MIELINVSKTYGRAGKLKDSDSIVAVNNLSLSMPEGEVFGLLGTNGAGKTTLLRIMAGVLKADGGQVLVDGQNVYNNELIKSNMVFIPDEPFFFQGANGLGMSKWYAVNYPYFDMARFHKLMYDFSLNERRRVSTFSKGMRKQLAVILALCSQTKYLLCDETMDGLDPVMRQATKTLISRDMKSRGLTPIMSSHNLRELEDICDRIGLMHKGGVLMSKDITDTKTDTSKVQAIFDSEENQKQVEERLNILEHRAQGNLQIYTVKQTREEVGAIFAEAETVYYELLPLTLEEVFISETEAYGYDIRRIINQ